MKAFVATKSFGGQMCKIWGQADLGLHSYASLSLLLTGCEQANSSHEGHLGVIIVFP